MSKYQVGQTYIYESPSGIAFRIYKVTHIENFVVRAVVLDSSSDYLSTSTTFVIGSYVDIYSRLYVNINKELENI